MWPAEFESYIHRALSQTQNVLIIQKDLVFKELPNWKSLGESTEDRAVADWDISKNTFTILTQVRQQQGRLGSAGSLRGPMRAPCLVSPRYFRCQIAQRRQSREVGTYNVTVRLGRSLTQRR